MMTDREARARRNQEESLAAFLAKTEEFDRYLAELKQASNDHFQADPEGVLWCETAWLHHANEKLKDLADAYLKRGDYAT